MSSLGRNASCPAHTHRSSTSVPSSWPEFGLPIADPEDLGISVSCLNGPSGASSPQTSWSALRRLPETAHEPGGRWRAEDGAMG